MHGGSMEGHGESMEPKPQSQGHLLSTPGPTPDTRPGLSPAPLPLLNQSHSPISSPPISLVPSWTPPSFKSSWTRLRRIGDQREGMGASRGGCIHWCSSDGVAKGCPELSPAVLQCRHLRTLPTQLQGNPGMHPSSCHPQLSAHVLHLDRSKCIPIQL